MHEIKDQRGLARIRLCRLYDCSWIGVGMKKNMDTGIFWLFIHLASGSHSLFSKEIGEYQSEVHSVIPFLFLFFS